MKLARLAEMGQTITVCLFIPACLLAFHIGIIVKGNRAKQEQSQALSSLQSALDHERHMNTLLSRRLEREGHGEQLNSLE